MSEHDPRDEPVGAGPLPDPDGHDDLSRTARDLRDALAARAAAVEPADRLEEIRMSTRSARRRTRAWQVVAVAAAVVVGGGAAAALRGGGGDGSVTTVAASSPATTSPAPSPSPTSTPPAVTSPPVAASTSAAPATSATRSAPATGTAGPTSGATAGTDPLPTGASSVPVYWLGGEPPKLFREYVKASGSADDPTTALRAMLAGEAADPDYASPWSADPAATVTSQGGQLVVDLAASTAAGDLGTAAAATAVQQLVYTVTAAAGDDVPVRVLVDGKAGAKVFGSYALPATLSRAPQAAVQAPAWITSVKPAAGSVTVAGVGTAFEGTLLYTVTDAAGAEVARDAVQAGANGSYAEFSFTAALPAGTYTVSVLAPDESGGEGPTPLADTKQVTVP